MIRVIIIIFVIIVLYVMYTERKNMSFDNYAILNIALLTFSLYLLFNGPIKGKKPKHHLHTLIYVTLVVIILLYVYYEALQ